MGELLTCSLMNGYYAKTTKANPLRTYGEDRLSISHAPSPPALTAVCDESNDGRVLVNKEQQRNLASFKARRCAIGSSSKLSLLLDLVANALSSKDYYTTQPAKCQ
jgi:hypothetical protein